MQNYKEKLGSDIFLRRNSVKSKMKAVLVMNQMPQKLRENEELFLELKKLSPDNKIPQGFIWASKQ